MLASKAMYEFAAIGLAARTRRSDMGLTQERVADLCGLSPPIVEQLENGSIGELDWAHAVRLLSVIGLSVHVSNPRSTRRQREGGTPALEIAARSASTSFKEVLDAEDLRAALLTTTYPKNLRPYVRTFLEEAPISLIADVIEQLHHETGVNRVEFWQHMRDMAIAVNTIREIWL
ncbi:helix-turn-helix domain-containing protein [Polaromonas sp. LjRoot131]|uniref:helix-turn-helix domain-containing protein n=1 Tax=Polaromonas sp. LjRoot131 TaxID=3342262 RepID=UPI003F50937A